MPKLVYRKIIFSRSTNKHPLSVRKVRKSKMSKHPLQPNKQQQKNTFTLCCRLKNRLAFTWGSSLRLLGSDF